MAAIRPTDQSADKWQRRSSVAQQDYVAGVQNPRVSWSAASQAADQAYRQGVTAAANAGRFAIGVKAAGDAAWQTGATQKGPARFAEGVQLAVGKWATGFQPYADAIKGLQLPPRGAKGSAQNLARVQAVDTALRAVRDRLAGIVR